MLQKRSLENLRETYFAVGRMGTGARIEQWNGVQLCQSELGHPVSNFALIEQIDDSDAARLAKLASSRQAFNIYALPGEGHVGAVLAMARQGWHQTGRLMLMAGGDPGPDLLSEAESFEERLGIARFMARQFFPRLTSRVREAVSLATAQSDLSILADDPRGIHAAAMLCRSDGALGIYNLCVEGSCRRQGLGSRILAGLVSRAEAEGRTAVLQCDPSLEPWYAKRRFSHSGTVSVLGLAKKVAHAIM